MTGIEIALLIIGFAIAVASFIFSGRLDGPTAENSAELTERQKGAIEKQIVDIFDEKMEELTAKQESQMDLIATRKQQEMNEYSETILNEINKNHNEVMFLYDMLNEKKKEVNNTVRDLNVAKAGMEGSPANEKKTAANAGTSRTKSAKAKVLDQLDAVSETVSDDIPADEEAQTKPKKKTSAAKTAASRTKAAVARESEREDLKEVRNVETGNNVEKILELHKAGKSNVEIAKELGSGIGEVKLVIDLFKGGRS